MHSPQITTYSLVIVFVICAIAGLALVVLNRNAWKDKLSFQFIQIFLLASIVFIYIDISFDGYKLTETIIPFFTTLTRWQKFWFHSVFVSLSISVIGLLVWKLKDDAVNVLFVLFSVLFVSTLFISGQKPFDNWKRSDRNLITGSVAGSTEVIIVFDGMIGVEGVDRSLPGGQELYVSIKDFHEKHGFKLFGKAFSRSSITRNSLPNTLNFVYSGIGDVKELVQDLNGTNYLLSNRFFDRAHAAGQEVVVLQTPFLNFCRHPAVSQCHTLSAYDPFNGYLPASISDNKVALALIALKESTQNSILMKYIDAGIYNLARYYELNYGTGVFFVPDNPEYNALSFNLLFDEFISDVLKTRGNVTYFAHFLFPHSPYVLDSECRPKTVWPSFPRNLTQRLGLTGSALQAARRESYLGYFDQVRCTYKKLEKLLDEMGKVDELKDSTIILMGDHGSRISEGGEIEYLSMRGIIDNHSTLFSARLPDQPGGYDTTPISVQQLLGSVQSGNLDVSTLKIDGTVVIPSVEKSAPEIVPFPNF